MIRNEKTYGFFRKTKKYGLVGCISFCGILVYGLTDNNLPRCSSAYKKHC